MLFPVQFLVSTMFYNVIIEPDNFISTLSEEMPQIIVTPNEQNEEVIYNELKSNSEIKSVLCRSSSMLK